MRNRVSNALHVACYEGHYNSVVSLVEDGANVDALDSYGKTPLHFALKGYNKNKQGDYLDIINYLLERQGANACIGDPAFIEEAMEGGDCDLLDTVIDALSRWYRIDKKDTKGKTLLFYAVEHDYDQTVSWLLDDEVGSKVNIKDKQGYTPLIYAIKNGYEEMRAILLEAGARTALALRLPAIALYDAIKRHDSKVVKKIIASGFDVNTLPFDDEKYNLLVTAISENHPDSVTMLIAAGVNKNVVNHLGKSVLMVAAERGNPAIVELFIKNSFDLNLKDENGYTALIYAIKNGNEEVKLMLIEAGAHTPYQLGLSAIALYDAIKQNDKKIITEIIASGFDVNELPFNDVNYNLLITALRGNRSGSVAVLIAAGADVNVQDANGSTPLFEAVMRNDVECATIILESDAKIDHMNNEGDTALLMACSKGYVDIVKLCLKARANIRICDKDENTPLLKAAAGCHTEIVALLLEVGAEVNKQNRWNGMALKWPAWFGNNELARMLIEAGADVNLYDIYGNTALSMALINKQYEVLQTIFKTAGKVPEVISSPVKEIKTTLSKKKSGNKKEQEYKAKLCGEIEVVSRHLDSTFFLKYFLEECGTLFLQYFQYHIDEAREYGLLNYAILSNVRRLIEDASFVEKEIGKVDVKNINNFSDRVKSNIEAFNNKFKIGYYSVYRSRTNIEAFNSMFGEVIGIVNKKDFENVFLVENKGKVQYSEIFNYLPKSHWWWFEDDDYAH